MFRRCINRPFATWITPITPTSSRIPNICAGARCLTSSSKVASGQPRLAGWPGLRPLARSPTLTTAPYLILRRSFHATTSRRDVFFVAFPALKASLLTITRVSLLILPFVYRYRVWKRWPRTSIVLIQIPIWAICIIIALALDQAPETQRWRLLMMSHEEELEWARHRFQECLGNEGPLIIPASDDRVQQVKRVAERIISTLEENRNAPTHIVSTALWPSSLNSSVYGEFLRGDDDGDPQDPPTPVKPCEPSAVILSGLMPYCPESSNPTKIFHALDWRIYVIDLPKINAFALPSRDIFVYRGLIDLLEDDSMLSGVLAHEIAHVQQRHAVENAGFLNIAAIAFDCLRGLSFAFTISFPIVTDAAATVLNFLNDYVTEKSYSRKLEMEADAVGLRIMSRAGYHPSSMLDLWTVMGLVEEDAAASGHAVSINDRFPFLRTHPTSLQRQKNISTLLPEAQALYDASPYVTRKTSKPNIEPSSQEQPSNSIPT